MAAIPALLYYVSVVITVEADSRRLDLRPVDVATSGLVTVTRSLTCGRRHHRRQPVPHDDAVVEVHAAGVRGADRVHRAPARGRRAAAGSAADAIVATGLAAAGLAAIALGAGGYLWRPAAPWERAAAIVAAALLLALV